MARAALHRCLRTAAVVLMAGVGSAGIGSAAAAPPGAAGGATPRPVVEPARGGTCVADPAFMRRNHMDLLKHQRDVTVHEGVRTAPNSLKACIDCHASRTTGSVAQGPTNFCLSCHGYAAVKIDCFECHASRPKATAAFHPVVPPAGRAAAVGRLAQVWRALGPPGPPASPTAPAARAEARR